MPAEILFATILVSFICTVFSAMAGIVLIKMLSGYFKYLKEKFPNDSMKSSTVTRGLGLAAFCIAIALFFVYRIAYVLKYGKDFEARDWFLYDTMIGVYMYVMSRFLLSLYRERHRLDDSLEQLTPEQETK